MYWYSNNLPLALILGSLAAATAPGGTTNILQEYRTRGPLTTNLLGVVGADDAFAIVIYALSANISKALLSTNTHFQIQDVFHIITYDIFGSIFYLHKSLFFSII